MLDDELRQAIQTTLPDDLPHVFISAVTGQGIDTLKDLLWASITDERNQIATPAITHRPLDAHHRVTDEDQFIIQPDPQATDTDDDTEEDLGEDYGDQGQWDTHWDYDDAAARLDDDGYPTTPQQ